MTVYLKDRVSATQALVELRADDPAEIDAIELDQTFLVEDEAVVVRGRPTVGGKLLLGRGYLGTVKVPHEFGVELTAIEGAPGGGLPSQWVVDENGTIVLRPASSLERYAVAIVGNEESNGALAVFHEGDDPATDFPAFRVKENGAVFIAMPQATDEPALQISSRSGQVFVAVGEDIAPGVGVNVRPGPDEPLVEVLSPFNQTAAIFLVSNDGTPFFRVDANGSVHIKTGTLIVADL